VTPREYIRANQMGFFEGTAVECLAKWRFSGHLVDAECARDSLLYILDDQDYQRLFYAVRERVRRVGWRSEISADDYIKANGIENPEKGVISHLFWWNQNARRSDLESALMWMDDLLEGAGG
jgi:hypothetical protein